MPTNEEAIVLLHDRVARLEAWQSKVALKIDTMGTGGFWDGLEKFGQNHPKLAMTVSGLLFAVIAWATYFSVPAMREVPVPGPEKVKVIVREVPVKSEPAGKQKADTVP